MKKEKNQKVLYRHEKKKSPLVQSRVLEELQGFLKGFVGWGLVLGGLRVLWWGFLMRFLRDQHQGLRGLLGCSPGCLKDQGTFMVFKLP